MDMTEMSSEEQVEYIRFKHEELFESLYRKMDEDDRAKALKMLEYEVFLTRWMDNGCQR